MIELRDVTKVYRSVVPPRPTTALTGMNVQFAAGEVSGIAGPNGAGKSTLLSLVLGFLEPTHGAVRIDGDRPRTFVERHGVAYLPELIAIPPWWRVTGALRRFAVLSGLAREVRAERVEAAIESLGLSEHRGKRIKQLSKGNRQRVGLAQALLSDARVVVFDEPTHGLDPVWTERFRELVHGLRAPDRCILIASHNLHELERVSDRVAILDHGSLTGFADLGESPEGSTDGQPFLLTLDAPHDGVEGAFPGAVSLGSDAEGRPTWEVQGALAELNVGLAMIIGTGATVRSFQAKRSRLESAFHDAVRER